MQELDFSGMNKIAYKGFENPEERDSLLEAGYTIVDAKDNPFTAPQASASPADHRGAAPRAQTSAGTGVPFTDHSGSRNYKRLYRIAHDFHQRHNPPEVDREYWRTHTPGEDEIPEAEAQYWLEAAKDVGETSSAGGNDLFLNGLITAIYSELEREYQEMRDNAHRTR